jgi:hypothetical protein
MVNIKSVQQVLIVASVIAILVGSAPNGWLLKLVFDLTDTRYGIPMLGLLIGLTGLSSFWLYQGLSGKYLDNQISPKQRAMQQVFRVLWSLPLFCIALWLAYLTLTTLMVLHIL